VDRPGRPRRALRRGPSGHNRVTTAFTRVVGVDYDRRRGRLTQSTAAAAETEAAATTGTGARGATAANVEFTDEKVEEEFNDERRHVEQAVDAAAAEKRQQPITGAIQVDVRISSHLSTGVPIYLDYNTSRQQVDVRIAVENSRAIPLYLASTTADVWI